MMIRTWLATLLLAGCSLLQAQNIQQQLKKHITYLASDELEGRLTGSAGEKLAAAYIASEWKRIGLQPKGSKGFLQPFRFVSGKKLDEKSSLIINNTTLELHGNFEVLPFSGSGRLTAACFDGGNAPTDKLKSLPFNKQILLLETSAELNNPHSINGGLDDLRVKATEAEAAGAAAIVFYSSEPMKEKLKLDYNTTYRQLKVPVLLCYENLAGKTGNKASLRINLSPVESNGRNVVAFLNNNAEYTVVLGAHYDHLGWGDEKHSLYRGQKAVHNGADDNASGVATLIELARMLKGKSTKHNFLFIAFSGEELGLIGSKFITQHLPMPAASISCMINFDMVGRVDSAHNMIVNGVGTSPQLKAAIEQQKYGYFTFKTTESGIGPSDHTSFYLADIPAIHFFSGAHEDYHKPSDDEHKINYHGIEETIGSVMQLIEYIDTIPKVTFTKTKEADNNNSPRFTVSLGIVPDYVYDGNGVRVDGVSDGKPAFKAGIQKGDIIVKLGSHAVTDMMGYMNALSKFKKGDSTTLEYLRNGQTLKSEITF